MVAQVVGAPGWRTVDFALLRHHLTWTRFALGQLAMGALALVLWHPRTAPAFALASPLPLVMIALYPLAYALLLAAGERLFSGPRLAIPCAAVLVYLPALVAALGACSVRDVSAVYGAMLWIPPCWGHLFSGNRTVGASIALSPLVLRLVAVPDASAYSLAAAAVIGLAAYGTFVAFSRRRARQRARRRRELVAELLGAPTAERAADRWTALRLHDRLSGVLMLALARSRSSALDDDVLRAVIEQARVALGERTSGGPLTATACADALRRFAARLGVELTIVAPGDARAYHAWRELHDLLVEVIANHARHGTGALRIELARRIGEVRADVRGSSALGDGSGRGQRNVLLRTEALGGSLRLSRRKHAWSMRFALPALDDPRWLAVTLFTGEVLAHVVVLGLVASTHLVVAGVLGALTLLLAAVQMLDMRRERVLHLARRAALRDVVTAATPISLEHARTRLGPLVDRLEHAVAGAPAELAPAIEDLAAGLGDVLDRLEHTDEISDAARAALA